MNLYITRKTIKKTVMRLTCQAFKHLINEWQGKMIFFWLPGLPVVLHSCGNKLTPFILNHYKACLLRNHLDWAHPLAVRNGVDDSSLQELGHLLFHHI